MDYNNLRDITVKSQYELDAIPDDYKGQIYIDFGTPEDPAIVDKQYYLPVVALGSRRVNAWGSSQVTARDNSRVLALHNSHIDAVDNSRVEAWGNSSVTARDNSVVVIKESSRAESYDNSTVKSWDNCCAYAHGRSSILARESSYAVAYDNSRVVARDNSSVNANDTSIVYAYDNSSVVSYAYSSIVAMDNSLIEARSLGTVDAHCNTQVYQRSDTVKVTTSGNARIIYTPKTANEYIKCYEIEHTQTQATLYMAVHKINGRYLSDRDKSVAYEIGKTVKVEVDPNTSIMHDCGIHVSHLDQALHYGSSWDDLAILEVKTNIDDIIYPKHPDYPETIKDAIRTSCVKVIREVPLEECGVYGQILANMTANIV